MIDTLEDVGWCVTILTSCIRGGIHTHNITNLFKQCYVPLMPMHTCMQLIHLIAIQSFTLLRLHNKN